jgi:stage II sporulation protein M
LGIRQLILYPRECLGVFRVSALILLAALAFGVVFGSVYVGYMDYYDLEELENGLNYFVQITDEGGQVSRAKVATNSLNTNGLFILYTTICGLTVIGLPLVVVMMALRGALLGFTTAYLIQRLAWRGLAFVLVTLFPFSVIMVVTSIFSGASAMSFSWLMLTKLFGKGDRQPTPILGFLLLQFGALLVMFALAMLEAVSVPWLFQRMLPWALSG